MSDKRSPVVVMTMEDVEQIREESYKEGWNAALAHVRSTNGEGSRHYL
jgi:hypothetical protein